MGLHGGAAKVRSYPEFRGTRQYVKHIPFQQSCGDKGKIMPVVCADSRSPKTMTTLHVWREALVVLNQTAVK